MTSRMVNWGWMTQLNEMDQQWYHPWAMSFKYLLLIIPLSSWLGHHLISCILVAATTLTICWDWAISIHPFFIPNSWLIHINTHQPPFLQVIKIHFYSQIHKSSSMDIKWVCITLFMLLEMHLLFKFLLLNCTPYFLHKLESYLLETML